MTKHETLAYVAAPTAEVITAPLADLYLSPINPRQEADPEGIALLVQSILACGLIQNLSGLRDEDGRIAIVAGGRRLRALTIAAEQNPALSMVPVRLAPDALTAQAWANAENSAREALAPAQEIRAYGKMRDSGAPVTSIARAFAVTEKHVYRRLALADLPAPVIDALAAGQISLGQAAAFTVATDEDLALQVLEAVIGRDYSEAWIKGQLQPQAVRSTDRRAVFVGLDTYKAAGGSISTDLFADVAYLQSPDLLDRLFAEKLEDTAAQIAAEQGWKWVDALEGEYVPWDYTESHKLARLYPVSNDLTEEEALEWDELSELEAEEMLDEAGIERLAALDAKQASYFTEDQKALSGCLLTVERNGTIRLTEGMVKPEDAAEAVAAGLMQANRHATGEAAGSGAPKSPYSQALVTDMKALRLAAVQGALLAKPELVLDLLAYALSPDSGRYCDVFGIRTDLPNITPTAEDGCEIDPRLTVEPSGSDFTMPEDTAAKFLAFQEQGKKHRNAMLTASIARLLNYGGSASGRTTSLFDHIEDEANANLRKVWTPTASNFFGRVNGPYLDALFADLLGADTSDERVKTFAKAKKSEKVAVMERLFSDPQTRALYQVTPEQAERIAAWQPDCF